MPQYEFECRKCGHVFEERCSFQITIGDYPECPLCQSDTKKLISVCDFHLKGSGWAKDGYGNKKK